MRLLCVTPVIDRFHRLAQGDERQRGQSGGFHRVMIGAAALGHRQQVQRRPRSESDPAVSQR